MGGTRASGRRQWSARRLFTAYAVVTLVPVVALALLLTQLLRNQADDRGMSEGIAEARLVARTTVAPLLDGDQTTTLAAGEYGRLRRSVQAAVGEREILRLRLRDLHGHVVFPDADRTGTDPVDDEALDAARGETVAQLTRLNADDPDVAPGPRVVEIYLPLVSVQTEQRIGVLEMYLPYDPIAAAITEGQRTLYLALIAGLTVLWASLIGVTASVVRHLRRETAAHAHLASHDALTGLPNRARLVDTLAAKLPATEGTLVVALLNVGRFRQVSDALGQANADAVLRILAQRLCAFVGDRECVARLGGGDFAVVASVSDVAIEEWLRGLLAVAREPIMVDGLPIAVDAFVGYEFSSDAGRDPGELIAHAAVALTAAKRTSAATLRYAPDQDQHDATALTLVAEIGAAIRSDQLVLHFQPKYDLRHGHLSSVEALIRWQHPTRGLLHPAAFLDAVEQTELIGDLTAWVLRRACRAAARFPEPVRVAVNISARSLANVGFAADVIDVVEGEHLRPERIILEVTETAVVTNPRLARHTLMQLREKGFAISIDDFGTGQTSLSQLVGMPIDELKIDRSFVSDMSENRRNTAVVQAVIDLGHSLGISVTAEGVESEPVAHVLAELGCDVAQGYYFSRPVPLAELLPDVGDPVDVPTELAAARRGLARR